MAEIDLHAGQVFVLNSLWNTDGQSQSDLAKALKLSAPTIYYMVVRMAERAFVTIKKDPNDARIMRVFLTDKGLQIKPQVEEQWQKLEEFTFRMVGMAPANVLAPSSIMPSGAA